MVYVTRVLWNAGARARMILVSPRHRRAILSRSVLGTIITPAGCVTQVRWNAGVRIDMVRLVRQRAPLTRSASGFDHTCGLRDTGAVECWGWDRYGEVSAPVGTFVSISAGGSHTCGLRDTGEVECWGQDNAGQSSPTVGTFVSVSAGAYQTCGVRDTGAVVCWGGNPYAPAGKFISVSAGHHQHTCGVRDTGEVECWGQDTSGEASPPAGTFASVSVGTFYSCGVHNEGAVVCWGNYIFNLSRSPSGTVVSVSDFGGL